MDRRLAASEERPVERISRTVPITSPAGISRPRFSIWPRTQSSRRGALSERGERRRLNRDGTRSELLFPCPTSEEHRLDRTQGEAHGLVAAHFLPRRPRRGEGLFIQRLLDGSQPLLIFRPLIRVHR